MLVEMKQIVKDFGPVRAVDHVNLTVHGGEILGLLGENGAGKSTLMNVLAGTFPPTSGDILLDGEKVVFHNAMQAMRRGIRFIHQELNLCNDLTVFENLYLAQEIRGPGPLLNKKEMARRSAEIFRRMNVDIDPWALVEDLPIAAKQLVEIARSLLFKCDLIIMDEPTTALSNREIENLFTIMRQLKEEGIGFIYISHKMPEIFTICDTYTVLRDGCFVDSGRIADIDEKRVTEMMIGRQLADSAFDNKPCYATEETVLGAENLTGETFRDISFALRKGEILAFTGLQSSGRDELADALFGVAPCKGTLTLHGAPLTGSVRRRMKRRFGMVPRNRKERGIHNDLSILDNASMGYYNALMTRPLISMKEELARYAREKQALSIKADTPANPITSLSGGNQQKVILARWLEAGADVLLFDNPTQGIDVGTKFEIYHLLIELARQGKSILIFSSEFPEIMKVADRCIILYMGQINRIMERSEMNEEDMMYYSTGANLERGTAQTDTAERMVP